MTINKESFISTVHSLSGMIVQADGNLLTIAYTF